MLSRKHGLSPSSSPSAQKEFSSHVMIKTLGRLEKTIDMHCAKFCYQSPSSSLAGGLQSNKSNASVLQGPTSLSITGLGNSGSTTAITVVSTFKLCVRWNFFLGSVRFTSAARADTFFFGSGWATCSTSTSGSVSLLDALGRLRFSQSPAVLGIGASFSLLTRLILRAGDFVGSSPSSSIGSWTGARFLDLDKTEANSVVLSIGPFLVARSGWGGNATVSGRAARSSSSGFFEVFVRLDDAFDFFWNPPVDNGSCFGETDASREARSDGQLCRGEMSLKRGTGWSKTVRGGGTAWTVSATGDAFHALLEAGRVESAKSTSTASTAGFFEVLAFVFALDGGTVVGGETRERDTASGEERKRSC